MEKEITKWEDLKGLKSECYRIDWFAESIEIVNEDFPGLFTSIELDEDIPKEIILGVLKNYGFNIEFKKDNILDFVKSQDWSVERILEEYEMYKKYYREIPEDFASTLKHFLLSDRPYEFE